MTLRPPASAFLEAEADGRKAEAAGQKVETGVREVADSGRETETAGRGGEAAGRETEAAGGFQQVFARTAQTFPVCQKSDAQGGWRNATGRIARGR